MDMTSRLTLPLLAAGQLQKEESHNEALLTLDFLVGGTIAPGTWTAPPAAPIDGQWYRVGVGATGEWAGQDGRIAALTPGGWRYLMPVEGLALVEQGSGLTAAWRSGAWEVGIERAAEVRVGGIKVVGGQTAAIADPSGGGTVDAEARTCLAAVLAALRGHGLIAI